MNAFVNTNIGSLFIVVVFSIYVWKHLPFTSLLISPHLWDVYMDTLKRVCLWPYFNLWWHHCCLTLYKCLERRWQAHGNTYVGVWLMLGSYYHDWEVLLTYFPMAMLVWPKLLTAIYTSINKQPSRLSWNYRAKSVTFWITAPRALMWLIYSWCDDVWPTPKSDICRHVSPSNNLFEYCQSRVVNNPLRSYAWLDSQLVEEC